MGRRRGAGLGAVDRPRCCVTPGSLSCAGVDGHDGHGPSPPYSGCLPAMYVHIYFLDMDIQKLLYSDNENNYIRLKYISSPIDWKYRAIRRLSICYNI